MWRARRKKIWVLLASIFLVFIVAFSESRAAYGLLFSYAILIPFFMSDRFTYTVKRIAAFSIVGALAAGVLYLFAGPHILKSVLERFSESQLLQGEFDITQPTNERPGDFARVIMFLETYNIVTTDPITGIGYYTFKPYMESQYPFGRISHNLLLSIWGEMGIFGFVTFVGTVSSAFRLAGKGQKGARVRGDNERWLFLGASKAALVVLLVHAMVRPQLTNPALWVVIAACLGVGWANRHHRSMPRTANSVSSVAS
jgi:O-antigen ligase